MSSFVLARYLDNEQRSQIAKDLSEDFKNEENVSILNELLETLDKDSLIDLSARLVFYFKDAILKKDFDLDSKSVLILLTKLSGAASEILNWISSLLKSTIDSKLRYSFSPEALSLYSKYFKKSEIEIPVDFSEVLDNILQLLEKLFSFENIEGDESLDKATLFFLTHQDEKTAEKVIKILRFRDLTTVNIHDYIWDLITILINSNVGHFVSNGYIVWLRFLISLQNKQISSEVFENQLNFNQYWRFIQLGLTSDIHEHRKYALSILKLSIQQINKDISNDFIEFNVSDELQNVRNWKRFCTLYEIVGVDTALNQAEAAKEDILNLLSLKSHIKPSWGLALLCTGFKGNMEAVRKFALGLMYQVGPENLSIFGNEYLTSVFLKYAIEAHHFQTKRFNCSYGDQLQDFIKQLLLSLKDEQLLKTVDILIDYLVEITSYFAPARVYLTTGLLNGLKKPIITESQINKLTALFESTAEDEIFEKYLQSIHLRLLKYINSNVPLLLKGLTTFVQINGYQIYNENIETFLDYISINHNPSNTIEISNRNPEYQVICYSLFDRFEIDDEFLKELALSKIDFRVPLTKEYSLLLTSLINGTVKNYKKSEHLVDLVIFQNSWRNIVFSSLFQFEFTKQDFDIERFKFFTKVYLKTIDVSDSTFFEFKDFTNLAKQLKQLNLDFKTQDVVISKYIECLSGFLKINTVSNHELNEVLSILSTSIGFYKANIKICETIQFLISNYLEIDLITVIEILESIWEQFSSDRLILNQLDMHLSFIKTLYHEIILKDCVNNEFNSKILLSIGNKLIELSQSRRSLIPCLSKQLLSFSKVFPCEFEQQHWLFPLLLNIVRNIQDDNNAFRLKAIIGSKFDKELALENNIYKSIYGEEEISSKINVIITLSGRSTEYLDAFFKFVVEDDPFNIINPKKKTDGTEELQRIFTFAILLFICKKVSKPLLSYHVSASFIKALDLESSPLIRCYLEWLVSIDAISSPNNRELIFELFRDQGKPTLVTSAERIAFLVSQQLQNEQGSIFLNKFTKFLIPNCSSNKPLIRHFSNSLILSIYPEIKKRELKLPVDDVLQLLYDEAKKSEITGKYRSGDALVWNAENDFNLSSIFGGILARISPRDITIITQEEFKRYIPQDYNGIPIGTAIKPDWTNFENKESTGISTNSPLQTKSGAWESVLDLDENKRSVKRSELIVVSSLVDKPPNLGGICRLCDVLGAGLMTVEDLRVKSHPQFKSVAVTADYWMPMIEVKDISAFMKEKKREGYTLIGLEQTDKSIVLGKDTKFPSKSLILLGREAEGIPGELLAELDYCIEIRQLGVIRSMNIQTATAVIVHAYSTSQTYL
ncbi:hypothetical protein WICMUC_005368 [Wickerhamomyces mucosus]|uniref:tRNA/rRNA methyltransferase SpoU type domain-containing protein n=1 Tax=Wickerhamomyces mucosus TaxID=1378264 RepID=A0A9P8T5Q1_9ASCO|nr:hypothetical protein WICMUC_005368 [Wickerhamomyces mucosus]